MFQSQSAAIAPSTNHAGARTLVSHWGRTIATIAATITTMPPGLNASEVPRWPCIAATHARVIPQNGHGIPVVARNGHASGGCAGSSGHTAAAPSSPAATTRTSRGARTPTADACTPITIRPSGQAGDPEAGGAELCAALLRDDDAFEHVLGVAVGRNADHARAQAVREVDREVRARGPAQREPAVEELPYRLHLVGPDRRDVPRGDRGGGNRDRCRGLGKSGKAVAGHDGSRGKVSEPLVVLCRDDRDRADEIEERQEVDDADDVSDRAGQEPNRLARVADDADTRGDFADRAAVVQHLERNVVGEHDQEDEYEADRQRDARSVEDSDPEGERDDDEELDHRVEQAGEES